LSFSVCAGANCFFAASIAAINETYVTDRLKAMISLYISRIGQSYGAQARQRLSKAALCRAECFAPESMGHI
jgi:hypothetical protein